MSKQHCQTGAATSKPAVPATAPVQKSAPLPLDTALLRQVSGGAPKGVW